MPVLLLDLDGVVVHEWESDCGKESEILLLHDNLGEILSDSENDTIVVTHRSSREAAHILKTVGIGAEDVMKVIAAEDIFASALRSKSYRKMMSKGLLKSFALPMIEQITGRSRNVFAMIDDKSHNLDAMRAAGIGLTAKAPFKFDDVDYSTVTFDLKSFLNQLPDLLSQSPSGAHVDLPAMSQSFTSDQRTGASTKSLQDHMFNRVRRLRSSLPKAG